MQELDSYLNLGQEHMVLGRHRGREGKSECTLCGAECESVVMCCGSVRLIVVVELVLC